MGKIYKFFNRALAITMIPFIPIDMWVVGKKKALYDWKLVWNDDGEWRKDLQQWI